MDIEARIERRRREDAARPVRSYEALSPVAHLDEPAGRGPALERLLDHLDPAFEGELPPNAYVFGPAGAGKSAVVTALFAHLDRHSAERGSVIHTATRAGTTATPGFVYVDAREATSEFALCHAVLDAVVDEQVPEHGVSTADVRDRLRDAIDGTGVVVAVDHVGEPGSLAADALVDVFARFGDASWLAVGREGPDAPLAAHADATVGVDPYRRQVLVDVVTTRASEGLARGALGHSLAGRVADWADGNAHDALAALFVAADRADRAGNQRVAEADVEAALADVPRDGVSLGRVFALPANRRAVLRELVDLDAGDRASVAAAADAVAASGPDLSPGTVRRFLYELADAGVLARVEVEVETEGESGGQGRPPSRVEPRFPTTVFRRLYDLRASDTGG